MSRPSFDPGEPPAMNTPVGPVWIADGADAPWRIRRVDSAEGLLKLGVTLGHLANCSHPHLKPPVEWWRDDDHIWVGAACPDGQPLDQRPPDRMTWSDAVATITPLALALRDAHRRGLVHGALGPWNVYHHEPTGRLTAVDFGLWPFEPLPDGPFRPPEMNREDRQPVPQTDVHNLTRLLLYFALSADEAQRTKPNFETLPAYAIATIERALSPNPNDRPSTIDDLLAGLNFHAPAPDDAASGNEYDENVVTGRVRDVETFEHPRRGEGIRFRLDTPNCSDESPGVFVYRDQDAAMFDSLSLLWDGAELTLINPREIKDSDHQKFLTAGDNTLPVIQPHWPVSVSDSLKARGCPRRVLVDMRDPGERTHHLAFGTLVHQFLEDLCADDKLTFEDAVDRRLAPLRIDFLAAGVDDTQLAELLKDGRRHFRHLRRFTARRTASAAHHDRVGWCGHHAEATRYSSRYGLEGRADLVVTDPDEGLQIIELKSGKPWHDHDGQVQSYALLWRQLAAANNLTTTGHLLYSKTGRMKQVPLEGEADLAGLVHGRNGLIALFRSFVDPDYEYRPPSYMEEPSLCRGGGCRFRRSRCAAQTRLLGDDFSPGDDSSTMYQLHFTRLVETERWGTQTQLGAVFQPSRLNARLADATAADDLQLHPAPGTHRNRALLIGDGLHVFTPGDRILVHRGDIDAHHVMRARVTRAAHPHADHPDQANIEVELRSATVADHLTGAGWIADILPSRIGYRTAHRALYRLLEVGDDTAELVIRPHRFELPAGQPEQTPPVADASEAFLNDSQLTALRRGLADSTATLIQGPPGTGKTTVIAHLACELAHRDQTVVLAALTNTAVDTMLVKLLDAAEIRGEPPPAFLRLGSPERSPLLADELDRRGLDSADYFADELAAKVSSLNELAHRLDEVQIVATTAHSSIRHSAMTWFENHRGSPAFDVALLDEASQLTEPMALAPITAADRFVLIGDHRQLPPIVTSERALSVFLDEEDIAEPLQRAGIAGLDRSLFERLAGFVAPHMLTTQYRMHRHIMAFANEQFYDGRLVAHKTVADHTLDVDSTGDDAILRADHPVVFVDIDGQQIGRTNPDEARAVIDVLRRLADRCPDASVGVISPFRAQVQLLRKLRDSADTALPAQIDTVERFQGNERDVICVSLVKTDHPGDFIADRRRLNVALTRARMKLILFGSGSCLREDALFRQWLDAETTTLVKL